MDRPPQFPTEEDLVGVNYWRRIVRLPRGRKVVGLNPAGKAISVYPKSLPLPKRVWVSKWGIAVDGWSLLGWGLASKTNLERLANWAGAWRAARPECVPLLNELIDHLEFRIRRIDDGPDTEGPRVFVFESMPDVHVPPVGGGYVQGEFTF
jgi:hypothetical protein